MGISKSLFLGVCIALILQSNAIAEEANSLILNYDILAEGKDIGNMTLKLSRKEGRRVAVEHSQIKISGWWWNINITAILSETFQDDTGFIKADSKTVYEDTAYWTKMNAYEDETWGEFIEITRMSASESKKFSHLSFAVTGKISDNTEELISLSEAMFSDRNKKPVYSVKFPQGSFDTTFNDLPFFIQKNAGKPLPSKLNILDTENLEISSASIKDLGLEIILIGKEKIQVRHLTLSDTQFKPSHLWIKEDANSLPYVVRHTGEDEDGKFEIILKAP
ncbi:MAG: hypothetical protein GXP08_02335 [Gammaproteobacteria bacterium]|nr:hypothetical protein [Gammaproteobacteria bacterium]